MARNRNQGSDPSMPNRASNMEQAEGSRENARGGNAGGITNRELDRERQEQEQLPERGRDAGRTRGGGNLGHGSERGATLPDEDDSSLNTKI